MRTLSCRRGVVVRLRRNLVRPQASSRRRCAEEVPAASRHRRLRAIIARKRSVELPMSSVPSGVLPRDKSFYPSCSTHLRAHNSKLSYYNIHLRRNLHYQKPTSKRTCLLLPHICILASFFARPARYSFAHNTIFYPSPFRLGFPTLPVLRLGHERSSNWILSGRSKNVFTGMRFRLLGVKAKAKIFTYTLYCTQKTKDESCIMMISIHILTRTTSISRSMKQYGCFPSRRLASRHCLCHPRPHCRPRHLPILFQRGWG